MISKTETAFSLCRQRKEGNQENGSNSEIEQPLGKEDSDIHLRKWPLITNKADSTLVGEKVWWRIIEEKCEYIFHTKWKTLPVK